MSVSVTIVVNEIISRRFANPDCRVSQIPFVTLLTSNKADSHPYSKKHSQPKLKNNYVEAVENGEQVDDVTYLFKIQENSLVVEKVKVEPFRENETIDSKFICFYIDIGASIREISEKFYYANFNHIMLLPSDLIWPSRKFR